MQVGAVVDTLGGSDLYKQTQQAEHLGCVSCEQNDPGSGNRHHDENEEAQTAGLLFSLLVILYESQCQWFTGSPPIPGHMSMLFIYKSGTCVQL